MSQIDTSLFFERKIKTMLFPTLNMFQCLHHTRSIIFCVETNKKVPRAFGIYPEFQKYVAFVNCIHFGELYNSDTLLGKLYTF